MERGVDGAILVAIIINSANIDRNTQISANHAEWLYNGLDCCVTLEVLNAILPQLDNVTANTYNFSLALQAPVLDMTTRGVLVDQHKRREVLNLARQEIETLGSQLDRICRDGIGASVSWRSPQQLMNLLYDVLGLPPIRKRNANGNMVPTVNRDAIERLGNNYFIAEPICNHLLVLRELEKKRQWLETGIDADGRMRCNYNIGGTNTGRLASSISDLGTGGNLQNVDRELRTVFIADEGMKFANLDLEQGDARNVGAICWNAFAEGYGEDFAGSYLNACESGDLHTTVCRMAWRELGWREGDEGHNRRVAEAIAYRQDSYRQLAKKLGHGTNYYGSPATMAKHSKVEKVVIDEFQIKYFEAFKVLGTFDKTNRTAVNWHNRVRTQVREDHSITTLLGRRRYFFGRHNDDETIRAAIAFEPQSLTADEIDQGLLRIWRAARVECLLQVHDSILIQFPEEQENEIVPWAVEELKTKMVLAKGREFVVPVDAKTGWNWGEWHEKNPDGLKKFKGGDTRSRTEKPIKLSLASL